MTVILPPCSVDGCEEESEVFWPDDRPGHDGEQRGYCGIHEPIYRGGA